MVELPAFLIEDNFCFLFIPWSTIWLLGPQLCYFNGINAKHDKFYLLAHHSCMQKKHFGKISVLLKLNTEPIGSQSVTLFQCYQPWSTEIKLEIMHVQVLCWQQWQWDGDVCKQAAGSDFFRVLCNFLIASLVQYLLNWFNVFIQIFFNWPEYKK